MKRFYEWVNNHCLPAEQSYSAPRDISEHAHSNRSHSAGAHLIALSLAKASDALADIKIVLPWLLTALGAPAFFIGWLVPLREALTLLPQLLIAHWIRRFAQRKMLWSLGGLIQGLSILLMALIPFIGVESNVAGWLILALLVVFSLGRCLCSIVIKDVKGKTIDRRRRGTVSGTSTSYAGIAGIVFAMAIMLGWLTEMSLSAISLVLAIAGLLWLLAAATYLSVPEQADSIPASTDTTVYFFRQWTLLLKYPHLIHFLVTRSLFLSTALVAPFYVILANQNSANDVVSLGGLILLTGIANLLSGRVWGSFADTSSRKVMTFAGALCGVLALAVVVGLVWQLPVAGTSWWYGLVIFVLYIGHAGVRLGRATYLVDMSNADNRARLVALSNTIIGIVLLLIGAGSAFLGQYSIELTITILGLFSFLAAIMAWRLPEISLPQDTAPRLRIQ